MIYEFEIKRADTNTPDEIFERLSALDRSAIPDGWSAESFRSESCKENGIVLYIENGGKISALLTGYTAVGEGDITNVAASPEFRRKGLAKALIEKFESMLGEDAEKVFLEVRESNLPAINLYKKCGYEELHIRKNFYTQPRENAIVMMKVIGKC